MPNLSIFTAIQPYLIAERSEATPGLFNNLISIVSQNLDQINSDTFALSAAAPPAALNAASLPGSGITQIQAAINKASSLAIPLVYLPTNLLPYTASQISFINAVQMVREGGDWTVYDVIAYGADRTGIRDSTVAVQAAITAASNDPIGFGQKVVIPQGQYNITSRITIPIDRVTLQGAGKTSSILYFVPSIDDTCLRIIKSGGTALITRCAIRALGFQSASTNTRVKTAINVVSGSETVIEEIGIVSGTWVNGSIGIQLNGRELALIRNVALSCDRPLVISKSSYDAIDCDHLHVTDFYGLSTIGSTNSVVYIVDGANVTNMTFDGAQAWVGGQTGLHWNDSSTTQVGYNVTFNNVRYEQSSNTNGWGFYIAHNTNLQFLTFNNCRIGPPQQGVYLRKVPWVQFNSCVYTPSNNTGLDIDSTVGECEFNNSFWQVGSTTSLTGLIERFRLYKQQNNSPLPDYGFLNGTGLNGPIIMGGGVQITQAGQNGTLSVTDGLAVRPNYAFSSETSLGLYRSGASAIAVSYGQFVLGDGSTNTPAIGFNSSKSVGLWFVPAASGNYLGIAANGNDAVYIGSPGGVLRFAQTGSASQPVLTWNSEASVGLYRSGTSTIAQSYGTFNLATNAVRLSMRTLGASSVTASAAKTNVAVDEVVFTLGGASGASLIIYSGGTAYGFNSAFSAVAS